MTVETMKYNNIIITSKNAIYILMKWLRLITNK